jgi:hypothetical protein
MLPKLNAQLPEKFDLTILSFFYSMSLLAIAELKLGSMFYHGVQMLPFSRSTSRFWMKDEYAEAVAAALMLIPSLLQPECQ